ncbi:MAG: hypothetical protein QS748_01350 [Candidatus Endonucleobacter bathymodioli]|uniref:Uncharacterized protein n=1 Tax=Candidatus Endonucleibacter bathymodioli TaxID=539814 RepID=A0AA90SLL4_9GAMM|nr:hypothetical protein [Candidatus Endonucleobacter bathymodioli]
MSVPDIYVSDSDRENHLMLKKKLTGSIQFDSFTSKLAVGPLNGVVHFRKINIRMSQIQTLTANTGISR